MKSDNKAAKLEVVNLTLPINIVDKIACGKKKHAYAGMDGAENYDAEEVCLAAE